MLGFRRDLFATDRGERMLMIALALGGALIALGVVVAAALMKAPG